ncbi:MAG: redox-sensing transcriptional repressor Rex [bacterium]|nr:redox-sensing transcriptional repressor Rex [bacterium]
MVNKKVVARLSSYRTALLRFHELGFVKVFSDTLAEAVGATSAQVRKDFSLFGISGNKKGGYQTDILIEKLQSLLGKDRVQPVIVVGIGNIGTALLKYRGFEDEGIRIVAGFDLDPAKINRKLKVPVLPADEMQDFIREQRVTIGIIAVPDAAAQAVCDTLVAAGIRGILNFAPIVLRAEEGVVVNNVNLQNELENVIYFVNTLAKQIKGK